MNDIFTYISEEEAKMITESIPLELDYPPYVNHSKVKKLEDLPRKAAIHILRRTNIMRAKGEVDEYIEDVLTLTLEKAMKMFPCILDIVECAYHERSDEIKQLKRELDKMLVNVPTDIGDIYKVFNVFVEYLFIRFDRANYFSDEPEYKNLIGKTVFEVYPTEIDPREIKKLDDLTKKDAQRLVRALNSFRRKDIVNRFLSETGDFESIYDLFQIFVGYIFHEYENAHYFLDEPELDPNEKEFQTREFTEPTKFEGKYD